LGLDQPEFSFTERPKRNLIYVVRTTLINERGRPATGTTANGVDSNMRAASSILSSLRENKLAGGGSRKN
jgi:hypothetical protein